LISGDGRAALTILLILQTLLLGSAAVITGSTRILIPCPNVDRGGHLIIMAGVLLWILLAIRLLCSQHFGGNVATFDLGGEVCEGDVCENNLAFIFNFNTISHFLQGALVFFLYQDIFIGVFPQREQWRQYVLKVKEFLALAVCGYPPYSFMKRLVSEATLFGSSSHWNNCCEWAFGFATGVCAIYLYYAILYSTCDRATLEIARQIPSSEVGRILRLTFGGLLLISAFASLIMLLSTWKSSA